MPVSTSCFAEASSKYFSSSASIPSNLARTFQYSSATNFSISLSLSTINFKATLCTLPALSPPVLDFTNFDTSKTKTEKEIKRLEHRINELQAIEKRLYEDMVLGKISEELFYNLSKEYDVEKKDIKEKLTTYYESIRLSKSKEKQIEMFVEVLKKYENIQELDAKLLNELIKQIVVY